MNLSFLQGDFAGLPVWAWAAIVGGGGILLALYIRRSQGGGASSGALGQNAAGAAAQAQVPASIDPYTGVPYSIEGATNPATGLPAYYGTTGTTPTPTPTPTPTTNATTRARDVNGSLGWWDKANPQGIPVRSSPAGAVQSYLPYGTALSINQGGEQWAQFSNASGPYGNVKGFYPVQGGGWVEAVDVANAAPSGSGPYQATPYWPIMTDVQRQGAH